MRRALIKHPLSTRCLQGQVNLSSKLQIGLEETDELEVPTKTSQSSFVSPYWISWSNKTYFTLLRKLCTASVPHPSQCYLVATAAQFAALGGLLPIIRIRPGDAGDSEGAE